jgi:hypothetical protein
VPSDPDICSAIANHHPITANSSLNPPIIAANPSGASRIDIPILPPPLQIAGAATMSPIAQLSPINNTGTILAYEPSLIMATNREGSRKYDGNAHCYVANDGGAEIRHIASAVDPAECYSLEIGPQSPWDFHEMYASPSSSSSSSSSPSPSSSVSLLPSLSSDLALDSCSQDDDRIVLHWFDQYEEVTSLDQVMGSFHT